jgi:hypothetical protein
MLHACNCVHTSVLMGYTTSRLVSSSANTFLNSGTGEQRVVEARRPRGQYIYQPTSRRSAPRWPSTPPPEQQCARWVRCRGARTCPVSPCTARTRSAGPRIHEEDAPGAAAETEAAHGRVERHTVGSVEVHCGSVPPARRAARS